MKKNRRERRSEQRANREAKESSVRAKILRFVLLALFVVVCRYHYGSALVSPPFGIGGARFQTSATSQNVTVSSPSFVSNVPAGTPTKTLLIINENTSNGIWVNLLGIAAPVLGPTTTISSTFFVPPGNGINPDGQWYNGSFLSDNTGNATVTVIPSW